MVFRQRLNIILIIVILTVSFLSCNSGTTKKPANILDTVKQTATIEIKQEKKKLGERLWVTGDFDGDGKMDTVYESYISELTGKETYKVLDSTDWEENVGLVIKNRPITRVYSSIDRTDTFIITKEAQQAGISFFENQGNLNGIKGDELGYVIGWADNSNLNTYYILTLTAEKKWKELFHFPINESVSYEPDNLFKNKFIILKSGPGKIKYKFYSDSATIETGETIFK